MSFWQRVKRFFTGAPEAPEAAPPADAGTAPGPSPAPPGPAVAGSSAPAAPPAPRKHPYQANEIMGLSAASLRRRALRITPWRTAWIGRTDVIPPASDERTALIDRGLVLRGLLTEAQLEQIHQVGDLWLAHREAVTLARLRAVGNAQAALDQLRQSRVDRKQEKQRLAAERDATHRQRVIQRRAHDIVYLGPGVSGRLNDRRSHVEALTAAGLPVLASPQDLATALELSIPRLRWLCHHTEASASVHYHWFEVPKRSGGVRLLAAPKPEIARCQAWIRTQILDRLPVEPPAHGFVAGRSTVTNARPHVGAGVVVNLDVEDFFPTITFPRVRGVFRRLGYSPAVATLLALLCTECPRRPMTLAGRTLWAAVGPRALPQGACTSPALSNQVARHLDRRLTGMTARHGWAWTRYADDLTFSASVENTKDIGRLMASVRHILAEEGFVLHPRKGRVQHRGSQQTVTGIVVNDHPALPRTEVRRLRAILHQARRDGLAAQNRENRPHFEAWLRGKLAYLAMVDPEKGRPMLAELDALVGRAPRAERL